MTRFSPGGGGFSIVMPDHVGRSEASFARGTIRAQADIFTGADSRSRVVVSRWKLSEASDPHKVGAFVQGLQRAFQASTKSFIDTTLHDQIIGKAHGGYVTMSFGDTRIGLWFSVQPDGTIYTVSFSTSKGHFGSLEVECLASFQILGH